MSAARPTVVSWEASAVLSALVRDRHSEAASHAARTPGTHLLSSLASSETYAVLARLERERAATPESLAAARDAVRDGRWTLASVEPDRRETARLARAWPLRGADLWHLAAATALRADLPELRMLSYDARLGAPEAG